MKRFTLFFLIVGLLLAVVPAAEAQTTINSTTLNVAITDTNATNLISLASIGSGATAVVAGNVIYVDGEAMTVRTTPTSASQVSVVRHQLSTPGQTHAVNSYVLYGPSQAFVSGKFGVPFYGGSCTASNYLFSPVIDVINGLVGKCQDSNWQWYTISPQISGGRPHKIVSDAAYTAAVTDEIIGYTFISAQRTVTIPAATGLLGKVYIIKHENTFTTNTIWVWSSSNIEGVVGTQSVSVTNALTNAVLRLYSDGSNWWKW